MIPKQLMTSFATLAIVFGVFAQQKLPKFGKVPDELVRMEYYALDSTAEAVVLYDLGWTSIDYSQSQGWQIAFQRHLVIKVFNEDGFHWANHEIPYYHDNNAKENVGTIRGFTYNVKGKSIEKTKLDRDAIFDEETNKYWSKTKVAMPNISKGSVFEIYYKMTSDLLYNLKPWSFQTEIPVIYSQYTTTIPEYFTYRRVSQGYHPFASSETKSTNKTVMLRSTTKYDGRSRPQTTETSSHSYQAEVNTLIATDLPAIRDEGYISSPQDYVTRIEYELQYTNFPGSTVQDYTSSWASVNEEFMESSSFGKQLDNFGFLRDVIAEINANYPDERSRIAAAYNYVRNNVQWNGFNSKHINTSLRSALSEGKGNCADINLLLTTLLRGLEIEAYPVLVSTRSNGRVKVAFPMSGQFNYTICLVKLKEGSLLLDATQSTYPIGVLPEKCLNSKGRIISASGGGWIDLKSSKGLRSGVQLKIEMAPDLTANGTLQYSKEDYSALHAKSRIAKGDSLYIEAVRDRLSHIVINSYEFQNLDSAGMPLVEKYEIELERDALSAAGNLAFFSAMLDFGLTENPFKEEKRLYPVDFTYPMRKVYSLILTIPEGFIVDEIPEAKTIALPDRNAMFMFNTMTNGQEIRITSMVEIRKVTFTPDEYPLLREFYSQIVEKHAEQIVLQKKT